MFNSRLSVDSCRLLSVSEHQSGMSARESLTRSFISSNEYAFKPNIDVDSITELKACFFDDIVLQHLRYRTMLFEAGTINITEFQYSRVFLLLRSNPRFFLQAFSRVRFRYFVFAFLTICLVAYSTIFYMDAFMSFSVQLWSKRRSS